MSDTNGALLALIDVAETRALLKSTNRKNRALFLEMATTIVALARRIAELEQVAAEKPRIVLPS